MAEEVRTRITRLEEELANPQAGLAGAALAARRGRIERELAAARAELARPTPSATSPVRPTSVSTPVVPSCSPSSGRGANWRWIAVTLAVVVFILLVTFVSQREGSYSLAPPTNRSDASPDDADSGRPAGVSPQQLSTYRDCLYVFSERRELADGKCDHLP